MICVKTEVGVDNVTIPTSEYTAMKNDIAQLKSALAPKVVFSQASSVGSNSGSFSPQLNETVKVLANINTDFVETDHTDDNIAFGDYKIKKAGYYRVTVVNKTSVAACVFESEVRADVDYLDGHYSFNKPDYESTSQDCVIYIPQSGLSDAKIAICVTITSVDGPQTAASDWFIGIEYLGE